MTGFGRKQTIANGSNRPLTAIQGRCRERRLSDRKAVVRLPRSERSWRLFSIGHPRQFAIHWAWGDVNGWRSRCHRALERRTESASRLAQPHEALSLGTRGRTEKKNAGNGRPLGLSSLLTPGVVNQLG